MDLRHTTFPIQDYDLAATLDSGQAFRWRERDGAWEGVIGRNWVSLRTGAGQLHAQAGVAMSDWRWLRDYLQLELDFAQVVSTFPVDEPLGMALDECRGLRLLRQPYWECLASFILSSTKQIVQIRQIVSHLCERFGERIETPPGSAAVYAFPTMERIAACSEADLRACKMGFRAPYLRGTAQMLVAGEVNLERLQSLPCEAAREELLRLPGVGRKIADCVLLFAYGYQEAFPVDVWVRKALQQLYFPRRRASEQRLMRFSATYFGPNAGYAQQYLFHYMRTKKFKVPGSGPKVAV